MRTVRLPQHSFGRGQLDEELVKRDDTSAYEQGCNTMLNYAQRALGSVRRRPGTQYLYDIATANARLGSFMFSEDQKYLFSWENVRVRIFNTSGSLLTTVSSAPWTTAMLEELRWTSRGDTTIVTHEDFMPRVLKRTGASSFTLSTFTFETTSTSLKRCPFYKYADVGITVTPAATTGTGVNLTASSAYWTASHVGIYIRIGGKQAKIASYSSSTLVTIDIYETLASTSATADWEEEAFSSIYGYPRICLFHAQRLIFAGHKTLPDAIWASKTSAFFNFDDGTGLDDESIWVEIGTDQVNQIREAKSTRHLQVFTNTGAFYVPESLANPFAPGNVSLRTQVPFGIALGSRAQIFDGATLFAEKTSQHVREFIFDDVQDAYSGESVSILSSDMINDPKDIVVINGNMYNPFRYAVVLNGDGTLAVFQSIRSEEVAGWAKWETDGTIFSIEAIDDELFALVQRTINSVTEYYLEKFRWEKRWTLDCAVNVTNGSPTYTFTGVSHLNGEPAKVVDDAPDYMGEYTPSGGSITISDFQRTDVIVGLDFTTSLIDMEQPITIDGQDMMGEQRKIIEININLIETRDIHINGDTIFLRQSGTDLSVAANDLGGKYRVFPQEGWDYEPRVTITQQKPLPISIAGWVAKMGVR